MAVLGKYTRRLQMLHESTETVLPDPQSMEGSEPIADMPDPQHVDPGESIIRRYLWSPVWHCLQIYLWSHIWDYLNKYLGETATPEHKLPERSDSQDRHFVSEDNVPVGEDIHLGTVPFGGGEASLQCNFIQSSSRWGRLRAQRAGVLFFSMIAQQKNYIRVKWAEFDVIFRKYKDHDAQAPAVLSQYVEPIDLPGKDISVELNKRGLFDPKLKVGFGGTGVEAEFGQKERSTNKVERYYWTLTTVGRAEEDRGRFDRAVWEWQANEEAPQASTKTLQGGAVVVSVIEGNFEIELRLRCRYKKKICGMWQSRRLGFRKKGIAPMIREVHSEDSKNDLTSAADKLWENIWHFNQRAQKLE
jgi:hypothetical protein